MAHLFGVQAVQRRSCTACTAGLANEWSVFAPPKNRGIFAVLLLFKLTVQYPNDLYSISDAYGLKTVQENALLEA
jgi:hypothetical protein